jgi:serine/threonine-protein kinase
MIDGRGRVKITDFGLASLAAELHGAEVRAGTPAYMAPEQLAAKEVTQRSDIYALGLVLYEIFTGKPALEGRTPAEIARRQETPAASPSSIVDGLDPAVERVILRCLEKEPGDRPASALAVAAALPGGDPLAVALAAGETPSPELVAAAGQQIEVPRWQPWTALAFFAVGLVPVMLLSGQSLLHNRIDLEMRPEVFEDRARAIAEELGHTEPPANRAIGLGDNHGYLRRLMETPDLESQKQLLSAKTSPMHWWYRESPESLTPDDSTSFRPSMTDPGWDVAGMLGVVMDSSGNLVELRRRPTDKEAFGDSAGPPPTIDWSIWFDRAGLDLADFAPVAPQRTPPAYADEVLAWEGEGAAYSDARIRVRAAALRGRLVGFLVEPSWDLPAPAPPGILPALIAYLAVVVAAVFFARRNMRLGRGDRRGARRLTWASSICFVAVWAFSSYHTPESTFPRLVLSVGLAMLVGGLVWVIYMASEPFVRRRWPDLLVSWARLIEGRWRDPVVGRDLVIGAAFAVALAGLDHLAILAPTWIGRSQSFQSFQAPFGLEGLLGGRMALGQFLQFLNMFFMVLFSLLVLVLVRVVTRRTWAAFGACTLVLFLFFASAPQNQAAGMIFLLVFSLAQVTLLMRFGLLAAGAAMWLHGPLAHGPVTPNLGAWYAEFSIVTLVLLVAVAVYGFVISFGGRSVIGEGAWEDA